MARSIDPEDYQHVARPVAAMPKDFAAGFQIPPHAHPRAQLVHAVAGLMWVETEAGAWAVPPRYALWIPAGVRHSVRMVTAVAMRTLYVDTGRVGRLPRCCTVIAVSPLLRELIVAAVAEPIEYDEDGRGGHVVALLVDELRASPAAPVHLPMPRDRRLVRIADRLLAEPARDDTLEEWGEAVGASPRTLARRFREDTGMSFAEWRQRARLVLALARLAEGEPVGALAAALGYRSASAFAAMFRRTIGRPPQTYRPGVGDGRA
ncbi:helix-turn-helix transcriptional regulator [Stella sp.]|uniref:AraC family transcriptional regulator n=1 Tax=Stella sp. TaxID=2912054 RepID=UPI0035B08694